jgi:hypothetical protein
MIGVTDMSGPSAESGDVSGVHQMGEDQRAAEPGAWPDWDSRDLLGLVKYVSKPALDIGAFGPSGRYNSPDPGAARALAADLFDVVARRRIPYGLSPWTAGELQRIRPSAEISHSEGTCLDLAVLYASMCWSVQLRPLIAVGGQDGLHAIVIIDLTQPLGMCRYPLPPPFEEMDGLHCPGIYHLRIPDRAGLATRFLAVDVTEAAVGGGVSAFNLGDFGQAVATGERWLLQNQPSIEVVDPLHARGASVANTAELAAPDSELLSVIRTRLNPPPGRFDSFPSRAPLEHQLGGAIGTVVLLGESGMGKSTLAVRRAAAADHGFGWTLTASDAKTLEVELAEAERRERDSTRSRMEFDRVAYAEMALARLRNTRAPWVVVLDNANSDPDALRDWMPSPGPDQTLIVTTTNAKWRAVKGADILDVPPLNPGEAAPDLPDWVERLAGGYPHFALALGRLQAAGVAFGEARSIAPADLMWQSIAEVLNPAEARAALSLAWLPSTPIPAGVLAAVGVSDADACLAKLAELGLVGLTSEGEGLMHRSFQQARRARGGEQETVEVVASILADVGVRPLLVRHADDDDLGDVRRALESESHRGAARLGLARAIEYRGGQGGVRAAAELAAGALAGTTSRNFPDPSLDLDPLDQADCWQLRARWIKDRSDSTDDDLDMAMGWMGQIRNAWGGSDDPQQALRASRADAMTGLIQVRLACTLDDPEEKRKVLLASVEFLLRSYHDRLRITEILVSRGDAVMDDRDRALFNFVRPYMELGKMTHGSEATYYFQECSRIYQECLEIRQERFGRSTATPMIASCKAGIGITQYNLACKALSEALDEAGPEGALTGPQLDVVTEALRLATRATIDALNDRVAFEGRHDGADTVKSLHMLAKISMMRSAVGVSDGDGRRLPARGEVSQRKTVSLLTAFMEEWSGAPGRELRIGSP